MLATLLALSIGLTPTACTEKQVRERRSYCICLDLAAQDYRSCVARGGKSCESEYVRHRDKCRNYIR